MAMDRHLIKKPRSLFGRLGRRLRIFFGKGNTVKRNNEAVKPSGEDNLDFSNEPNSGKSEKVVVGAAYDPRPHEDGARRTIAYLLIGLLWLVIAAMLLMISFGYIKVEDLKDFSVILGPIITLVSAATGFYYGTKTSSR